MSIWRQRSLHAYRAVRGRDRHFVLGNNDIAREALTADLAGPPCPGSLERGLRGGAGLARAAGRPPGAAPTPALLSRALAPVPRGGPTCIAASHVRGDPVLRVRRDPAPDDGARNQRPPPRLSLPVADAATARRGRCRRRGCEPWRPAPPPDEPPPGPVDCVRSYRHARGVGATGTGRTPRGTAARWRAGRRAPRR